MDSSDETLQPTPEMGPLVVVFRTTDCNLWPIARSLLQAEGIPFVTQGEEALGLLPLAPAVGIFSGRGLEARILVPESRRADAEALLQIGTSQFDSSNPPEELD